MRNVLSLRKLILLLLYATFCSFCFAQVKEEWARSYDGTRTKVNITNAMVLDASGNVYVTGKSERSLFNSDFVTIKYDAAGNLLWVQKYNGLGNENDFANAIAIDAQGNVYVTGASNSSVTNMDYVTIKYDASGNQLWIARYDGPINNTDHPNAIAVDAQGNVYVTGQSATDDNTSSFMDYATIKYDAAGNQLWVQRYNGPGSLFDYAYAIATDALGNVYVTGASIGSDGSDGYATIKYDAAGNQLWVQRYEGIAESDYAAARALALDALGNVYITGESNNGSTYKSVTIKYNTLGQQQWSQQIDEPGQRFDLGTSLAVDLAGNVYITGHAFTEAMTQHSLTVKYNTHGQQQWVQRYNELGDISSSALSLALDEIGNVYVTGMANNGTDFDCVTIKYSTAGKEEWVQRYAGVNNEMDEGRAIAVSALGDVYVALNSLKISAGYGNIVTVKYSHALPPPAVKVTAGADKQVYYGYGSSCTILTAQASEGTPPYRYSWSTGVSRSSSIEVCPSSTTTYTITVTDARGQTASDEVMVKVVDVSCGKKGNKVMVCHKGKKTLCIDAASVADHLAHGDRLGICNTSPVITQKENLETSVMEEARDEDLRVTIAPNPFSTTTRLHYYLPADGKIIISLIDATGREIKTLANGERKAGAYSTDISATGLSNGLYYYRVLYTCKGQTLTRTGKMVIKK